MSSKIRKFSSVVSTVVIFSFCLLQSHSYALAEVSTPESPFPIKLLKNFSVIGTVSEVNFSTIKVEEASGSDGTKNMNYVVGYHSPIVENQLYESLSISDVSVGDRVIAQGGIDKSNCDPLCGSPVSMIAKRIIVFSSNVVPNDMLKIETASSTASSTDELNTSTSTESVETFTGKNSSTSDSDVLLNSFDDSATTTDNTILEFSTTTATSTDGDNLVVPKEEDQTIISPSTDISTTSATVTTGIETATTSTISTSSDIGNDSLTPFEDDNSSSTTPIVEGAVSPNDKNRDTAPVSEDPDPIDSGSPIICTPVRDENVVSSESLPEPEPEQEPKPEPRPETSLIPSSSQLISETPSALENVVLPAVDSTTTL